MHILFISDFQTVVIEWLSSVSMHLIAIEKLSDSDLTQNLTVLTRDFYGFPHLWSLLG
jgi:hypothetical protein